MKSSYAAIILLAVAFAGTGLSSSVFAQGAAPSPGGAKTAAPDPAFSDPAMMAKMMELAQPGENHKLLAELVGTWDYQVKFWMTPGEKPNEASGTATRKAILGGRYFLAESKGTMQMPGPDGKMQNMDFAGLSLEGYDNVKQKFISTWSDNMGTSILMAEGTYDPAAKTFTYLSEMEMMPGMKTKVKETVKVVDKNHHLFEWFEDRGGELVKTMEIKYERKSS